jgi:hypothetical protein
VKTSPVEPAHLDSLADLPGEGCVSATDSADFNDTSQNSLGNLNRWNGRSDGVDSDDSSDSPQYLGPKLRPHIPRPHISRSDPFGPYIDFWAKVNGPCLADVCKSAYEGCHLCTLVLAAFLISRSNRVFGKLGASGVPEVFDSDEVLMQGRVFISRENGSRARYVS